MYVDGAGKQGACSLSCCRHAHSPHTITLLSFILLTATAAQDLLRELIRGGLQVARERQSGKGGAGKGSGGVEGSAGPVIIQPEDMCGDVSLPINV